MNRIRLNALDEYFLRDHLALNITKRCNQKCIFCFEGDRKGWDELSVEKISDFVQEAVKKGIRNLIFMGAEALLRKDIFDIINVVKELGIKRVGAFTNGQILSREGFIEQIANSGLDYLDISFHYADAETFARCTRTPEKLFYNFIKGLERLDEFNKKNNGKIGVITKTLLFSQNQGQLDLILRLISRLFKYSEIICGIKRIQLTEFPPDIYLLDNLKERRKEIKSLHFGDKNIFLPVCLYV